MKKIKNRIVGGLAATIVAAALTGCESLDNKPHDGRSAGRVLDDKNINSYIQTRLKEDPTFKFHSVDVRTFGGVVQLSGFVGDPDARARAEDIARNTGGVNQVVNSLVLTPESMPTPTGHASGQRVTAPPAASSPNPNQP